ncbi:hypothetical protein B0H10DRAFT_1947576 [Mycena sp. CBHHK59/15]|nr:hypothetical protein B0H10DRAFT_1947576 [Mycena sp. CBHHK59/15]
METVKRDENNERCGLTARSEIITEATEIQMLRNLVASDISHSRGVPQFVGYFCSNYIDTVHSARMGLWKFEAPPVFNGTLVSKISKDHHRMNVHKTTSLVEGSGHTVRANPTGTVDGTAAYEDVRLGLVMAYYARRWGSASGLPEIQPVGVAVSVFGVDTARRISAGVTP